MMPEKEKILEVLAPFVDLGKMCHCWFGSEGEITSPDASDFGRAETHELFVSHEEVVRLLELYAALKGE